MGCVLPLPAALAQIPVPNGAQGPVIPVIWEVSTSQTTNITPQMEGISCACTITVWRFCVFVS